MNVLSSRLAAGMIVTACSLLLAPTARAQSADPYEKYKFEALQFSQLQATGTTRTQSMGGAGSALGADLGSSVLNPANLGSYRRSEFSFTPGLQFNSTESTAGFAGQARTSIASDGRNSFNIANLGVVITTRTDNGSSDWRSGAVGINFSRLATLSNRRTYALAGLDSSRSLHEYVLQDFFLPDKGAGIIEDVVENSNEEIVNNFADLAFNTKLLDFEKNAQGQYTGGTIIPKWYQSTARQSETTELRGAVNQIDIGYGASYRDKLYVGGSLGIVTMRYQQTRTLTETLDAPRTGRASEVASLSLRDGYETQGAGVNLRVGLVYRPNDVIRLGAAIQTPTFASGLKEKAEATTLTAAYRQPYGPESVTSKSASIVASEFQYNLTTPFRATGGLTLIFKSAPQVAQAVSADALAGSGSVVGGLISADIDYVNYGAARLSAIDNDPVGANFSAANAAIRTEYASAINYRVGAELRLGDFRVRGGYGRYGTPYQTAGRGGERTVIGGGVGIRREKGYVDIGFSRTTYTADLYRPYELTTYDPTADGGKGDYKPYSTATAAEPVISASVTLLNPTVTIGFIIE
ncbi:MAG: hypothetical protein H7330_12870 [Hymenobacteraceae bacterium]|nr:hypothetical protein [Hymenobacteraceae bacterium]